MPGLTVPAAVLAAGLFLLLSAFQVAIAAGAPLGDHVLGGRHPGTLPPRLRMLSAIVAGLLAGFALVILGRAGVIGLPGAITGVLAPAAWAISAFLVVNTVANLASKSRFERTAFATTTAVLAVVCGFVALTA